MSPRRSSRALLALVFASAVALVATPVAVSPIAAATAAQADRSSERRAVRAIVRPTLGDRAVSFALKHVGVPYRWGGESPASGFDCSGLVRWSYGRVGVDVPHNSYALFSVGRRVSRAAVKPGDVLFFEGLGHVGLYIGRGRMVHAPYSGRNVEIVRLAATNYGRRLIGARRPSAS